MSRIIDWESGTVRVTVERLVAAILPPQPSGLRGPYQH